MKYNLRSKVWVYPGMDGWHFVNVSKQTSKDIKETFGGGSRGFGSLPVEVTVGATTWRTSIFPDKKSGTYLLPLKAAVRKQENIREGASLTFTIEVRP